MDAAVGVEATHWGTRLLCSSATRQGLRRAMVLQALRGGEQGSEGSQSISQDARSPAPPNPTRTPRQHFLERAARCRRVLREVPAHSVGTGPRAQPAQAHPLSTGLWDPARRPHPVREKRYVLAVAQPPTLGTRASMWLRRRLPPRNPSSPSTAQKTAQRQREASGWTGSGGRAWNGGRPGAGRQGRWPSGDHRSRGTRRSLSERLGRASVSLTLCPGDSDAPRGLGPPRGATRTPGLQIKTHSTESAVTRVRQNSHPPEELTASRPHGVAARTPHSRFLNVRREPGTLHCTLTPGLR